MAQVKPDDVLANRKQQARDHRAGRDVRPGQLDIRQELEEQAEEDRGHRERDEEVDDIEDDRHARCPPVEPGSKRREGGAHGQRHQQQEADGDHQTEGTQPVEEERLQVPARRRRDPPDGIQRRLQLEEGAARGENERDPSDRRDKHVLVAARRALQQRLNGFTSLDSHEPVDLTDDFSTNGFGSEECSGHRDRNEENGPDRKERVVGQRCSKPHRVVIPPRGYGPADDAKGEWEHFAVGATRDQFANGCARSVPILIGPTSRGGVLGRRRSDVVRTELPKVGGSVGHEGRPPRRYAVGRAARPVRPVRLATMATSSAGSTGLARCVW